MLTSLDTSNQHGRSEELLGRPSRRPPAQLGTKHLARFSLAQDTFGSFASFPSPGHVLERMAARRTEWPAEPPACHGIHFISCFQGCCMHIWHSPGHPHPPPPGMVMVPCPAPCGSGWGGCGWVAMLVDGVVVFANDVESYGICKELDLVRERRQTWKAHSLMMGQ